MPASWAHHGARAGGLDRRPSAVHVRPLRDHAATLEAVSQVLNGRVLRRLVLGDRGDELSHEILVAEPVHAGDLRFQAVAAVPEEREPLDQIVAALPVRTEATI